MESQNLDYNDIKELIQNRHVNLDLRFNRNLDLKDIPKLKVNFECYSKLDHPKLQRYYKKLYSSIIREIIYYDVYTT